MFTKIGEYLKPILGRRDHIPLDAIAPVDPDEHHGEGKGKFNKKQKEVKTDEAEDTMSLSLNALQAILEKEMIENIDLYAKVKYLILELNKKNITHISMLQDEKLFHALERVASSYGIKKL